MYIFSLSCENIKLINETASWENVLFYTFMLSLDTWVLICLQEALYQTLFGVNLGKNWSASKFEKKKLSVLPSEVLKKQRWRLHWNMLCFLLLHSAWLVLFLVIYLWIALTTISSENGYFSKAKECMILVSTVRIFQVSFDASVYTKRALLCTKRALFFCMFTIDMLIVR